MRPAGGSEDPASAVIAVALHELADAGAGGLYPLEPGRQFGQVFAVRMIEVEEDFRFPQQRPPFRFFFLAAFTRRSVISLEARRADKIGPVDDIEGRRFRPDARDMLRLKVGRDQDFRWHVQTPL